MRKYILGLILMILAFSCADKEQVLPNPSGRAGEVLVVMNDSHWEAESGKHLNATLTQQVAGLPWAEPIFDVSRLPRESYNDLVRIARNIVDVEVGNRYSVGKVKFFKEKHSRNQAYVKIQAPDEASLLEVIKANKLKILSFFYSAERDRLSNYFAKNPNDEYQTKVEEILGYQMVIPSLFNRSNFSGENFLWMTGGNTESRTDLALYVLPCSSEEMITAEYLVEKRDSAMKVNIGGPSDGSYVRTADIVEPVLTVIDKKTHQLYELRGLWETTVDFMGGPFVSYAYYDAENNQLKVLEGFVYAPHEDKRNLMRRLEAVAYSWDPTK